MTAFPLPHAQVPLHALFQRRAAGDDALLHLTRTRFEQAALSAEVYAEGPEDLEHVLGFVPPGSRPPTVHLSRDIDLLTAAGQEHVHRLARRFGGRVSGFVVHDRGDLPDRLAELTAAAGHLSDALAANGPAYLFVEYAAGVPPERFAAVGKALHDVERVATCVDIGHLGVRQTRHEFARRRPDVHRDITWLDVTDPALPGLLDDVDAAVASVPEVVLGLIADLAAQGKPVHFHLHDGHPLVRGLSDHFGFLTRLPLPYRHRGIASLAPMFGVTGLRRVLETIDVTLGPARASLTLEIHQHSGRLPLPAEDVAHLFRHWGDLTTAEWTNSWLAELAANAVLVRALTPSNA